MYVVIHVVADMAVIVKGVIEFAQMPIMEVLKKALAHENKLQWSYADIGYFFRNAIYLDVIYLKRICVDVTSKGQNLRK